MDRNMDILNSTIQNIKKMDIAKMNISNTKIKDSMTLGLLGGFLGTIAMELTNFLLWRKGKTENLFGHLAGSMMMRAFRTNQRKNFILGELFHLITGSVLGVLQIEVLKKYGKDNHLLKGGITGLVTWGVLYNFGQRMQFFSRRAHLTKTHYATLLHNLIYGVVASQVIVSMADSSIFSGRQDRQERQTRQQERQERFETKRTSIGTEDTNTISYPMYTSVRANEGIDEIQ